MNGFPPPRYLDGSLPQWQCQSRCGALKRLTCIGWGSHVEVRYCANCRCYRCFYMLPDPSLKPKHSEDRDAMPVKATEHELERSPVPA